MNRAGRKICHTCSVQSLRRNISSAVRKLDTENALKPTIVALHLERTRIFWSCGHGTDSIHRSKAGVGVKLACISNLPVRAAERKMIERQKHVFIEVTIHS